MEEKIEKPTLAQLWQDIKKHKRVFYKVLPATFIVTAILTLSMPNYYKCTVMLAPELSGGSNTTNSLSSLANSFGIKLGSGNTGSEALFPTLYPDLMNSVAFRASLFPVQVKIEDENATLTYYDYLKDHQRMPWWSAGMKAVGKGISDAISSIFGLEKEKSDKVNPFRLTKEQMEIVEAMEKKVVCDVDNKTLVITIDVTDQDPLIAATMADSVQVRLQNFITDYRTRKARIDLAYSQKLYKEAQQRYEKARVRSASYNDANMHVFINRVRSEQVKLENEMALQYQAYSHVVSQLQLAEAKVQEDTPAFTLLQPATVPVRKAGPKRSVICLALLFLAFLATTLWIIHREGHLLPIFQRSGNDDDFDEDDLLRALVKLSAPETEKAPAPQGARTTQ